MDDAQVLAIVEAPDSVTMAGISSAIRSTGSVVSETYELFSTEDIRRILATARQVGDHFTRPGQSG